MPRQVFRDWRPDLPDLLNPGLVIAKDTVPIAGGFGPRPTLVDAGEDAAAEEVLKGYATRDNARNPNNFAGTASKLYRIYTTGLLDVSKAGGYQIAGIETWNFDVFGSRVFACNYNDNLQYFDMRSSALFADVEGDYVPRFRHLGVVGNFLMGGNYFDGFDGAVPNGIAWSAIGSPLDWPEPGSDDAASKLSDRQPLEGDGGWVTALVSGAEVTAIFQERAIWRMDFRGGVAVFELNRVEPSYGCLVPDLAVPFGRRILFLSESGFRLFDYTSSQPAGKERIDRYFLADLDLANSHRVTALRDPDTTRIWISYPGVGNVGGTPNRLIIYDYELDKFTHGDEAIECLVNFLTPNMDTLDSPPPEDIDAQPPGESFDDEASGAGAYSLGAWATDHKLGSFTGGNKDAVFRTGYIELMPGRRALVTEIRPLINGDDGTTTSVAAISTTSKTPVFGRKVPINALGFCPHRADGRYHQIETIAKGSDFVEAIGLDITAIPSGVR